MLMVTHVNANICQLSSYNFRFIPCILLREVFMKSLTRFVTIIPSVSFVRETGITVFHRLTIAYRRRHGRQIQIGSENERVSVIQQTEKLKGSQQIIQLM